MPSVDTRNVCCLSPQGLPARDEDDGDDGGDDSGDDDEDFV